ncbi:glycosylphosphatidylinositol anchor biosynthesis [Curvularia kusanoi]|uniref:Mannosyltransferase n=1 Tax=Curvularia kusanoi TaxID=90978 RepID=A0A9P4W600_CURKU|nr:glycosylphosphatidylinositol anchor biosynthesis [Curvularia kusanoi]
MPSASDYADATTAVRGSAPPGARSTGYRDSALGVLALLLAFRTVNALTLRTFFQPDEFFQSLEPAWQLAFGGTSNAWITWTQARLRYILVREAVLCGSLVLGCSVLSDRAYYGIWTLPPLRFLYFNIAQSLAVFYGRNRPDYYFTEGLPLLLTTALPFAAVGLWQSLRRNPSSSSTENKPAIQHGILSCLAWTSLTMTTVLSLISHKEVRFLYPILPFLHLISAHPLSHFLPRHAPSTRRIPIALLLGLNLALAFYASQTHQRGVISVLDYLRHKHEARNSLSLYTASSPPPPSSLLNTSVAFLMPCHSTPWRSHLVYPHIDAWALTCDPPLDIPLSERSTYLDEADHFYINPGPRRWLRDNMESVTTVSAQGSRSAQYLASVDPRRKAGYRRKWPQNLGVLEGV